MFKATIQIVVIYFYLFYSNYNHFLFNDNFFSMYFLKSFSIYFSKSLPAICKNTFYQLLTLHIYKLCMRFRIFN